MDVGRVLRAARQRAGLTQRELAARTGVAQPTIARIETGAADPRMATILRLLRACGQDLNTAPAPGAGVDRTQFGPLLRLTPRERLELLRADAASLERLEQAAR
jgi:transcriptional regulator with XRE-family HTH domain